MKAVRALILMVGLITAVFGCQKTDHSEQILSDLLSHKTINHFRFVSKDIIEKNRTETDQSLLVEYDVTLSTDAVTIVGVSTLSYAKDKGKLTLQRNDLVIDEIIPFKAVDAEMVKNSLTFQRGTGIYSRLRKVFVPGEIKSEVTKISETQYEVVITETYQDGIYQYEIEQLFIASFDLVRGWEYIRKGYIFSEIMDWSGVYDIAFDIAKEDPESYKSDEYSVDEVIRVTIDGKVESTISIELVSESVSNSEQTKNVNNVLISFSRNGKSYKVKPTEEHGLDFFYDRFPDAQRLFVQYEPEQTKQLYIKYGKMHDGSLIGFSALGQIIPKSDYDFPASMTKITD
ncbi:MAG: hypothetical protein Q8N92_09405 [Erysipelotrichaceae bacterium]|nr:hypothetical protein [Erysipelotrichaceae bacterium]